MGIKGTGVNFVSWVVRQERTAPTPVLDVSTSIINCASGLGCTRIEVEVKLLRFLKVWGLKF